MVTEYPFQSSQMPAKATHRETIIFVHTLMSYSCKDKGEVLPITGHEDPKWEQMYSCTLSITSALDRGRWLTPRPGRFTPGKDPVPIVQEAG